MALLPKLSFKAPRRTNRNLSHIVRFTASPGVLDPILTEDILPGDTVKLDIIEDVLTYPTLAPILGSFTVETTVFFTPWRNWYRMLHEDAILSSFDKLTYGTLALMPFHKYNFKQPSTKPLPESSLLAFLGFRPLARFGSSTPDSYTEMFNAHGLISYLDIFRTYFMDPQVNFCFQFFAAGLSRVNCSDIQAIYDEIVNNKGPVELSSIHSGSYYYLGPELMGAHIGKFVRSYAPDVVNVWLDSSSVSQINSGTSVEVVDGKFSIDSLNLASKLKMYFDRIMVSGNRYSGFVGSLFGQKIRRDLNIPQLLGRFSQELSFKNVVQQSASTEGSPLGTLAGFGHSTKRSNRTIKFTAPEFGTLQVIHCIIPHPDYYQRFDPQLKRLSFADCYNPMFDKIGFEPQYSAFRGYTDGTSTSGGDWSTVAGNPFKWVYGYLPAWSSYTSRVNRLLGDFVSTLRYWTLAQPMGVTNAGTSDPNLQTPHSYIMPYLFNYAFADTSKTAQNFLCQVAFGLRMKRPISKSQLPNIR
ncbi:major capsid protein [Microvirus mar14]|uniref:Major capsid protein n=1 Tax=Microvirus mar14 TaxID=2851146 RepID=A0A8F5MIZ5_9VIRU|nr:major capsid protein [Microvirus mar14]